MIDARASPGRRTTRGRVTGTCLSSGPAGLDSNRRIPARRNVRSQGERTMDIRFECVFEGKKLYQVVREHSEIAVFTGTAAQCRRFMEVYQEKVSKARNRDRRPSKESSPTVLES